MIIKRQKIKIFASTNNQPQPEQQQGQSPTQIPTPLTSRELMIEQMRLQRQVMLTQRWRQKIQAQESRDQVRAIQNAQKADREEKAEDAKNTIKARQIEADSNGAEAKNIGLYKTRSKVLPPVPMKK